MQVKAITLISCLLCGISCAGTILDEVSDEKYIEYGKKYECVLKIRGIVEENNKDVQYYGSCVVIDKNWVATAAHVVKGTKKTHILFGEKEIEVERIIMHPDFDEIGSTDIAVCKLKKEIELPFYPQLYEKEDEIGKKCGIAGYGGTGAGSTGTKNFSTTLKRAGSNKVEYASSSFIFCTMSKKNPTSLEFCIAHGDSGGGLFIDGKLAGINSSVLAVDKKPDSSYGDESSHTRISKCKSWIDMTLNNQ